MASRIQEQRDYLAGRVSSIDEMLPRLSRHCPAEVRARMRNTLNEARQLVEDCQRWRVGRYFAHPDDLAERFSRVNPRIDRRLNEIEPYHQIYAPHPGMARAIIAAHARAAPHQLLGRNDHPIVASHRNVGHTAEFTPEMRGDRQGSCVAVRNAVQRGTGRR